MRIPRAGVSNEDNNDNNSDNNSSRIYPELSWKELKEKGKSHYTDSEYSQALECYRAALLCRGVSEYEQQLLLSNIVACRLKINTSGQIQIALIDAKKCIELNQRWSKGHIRLASVYIAMGKSNDACNCLQRALQLDPSNQTARNMLTNELRRERVGRTDTTANNNTTNDNTTSTYTNASAPDEVNNNNYSSFTNANAPEEEDINSNIYNDQDINTNNNNNGLDLDDETSPWEKLQYIANFYYEKFYSWHMNLGDDTKSFLQVCVILIVLYILLGGRFGLAGSGSNRGNYNTGNAYDQFYNSQRNLNTNRYSDSYSSSSRYNNNHHSSSSYYDTYGSSSQYSSATSSVYDLTNVFSLLLVFTVMYIAHKYAGIHPFQALWIMNIMDNRRRGRYGGFGGGFGGFGRGFGGGFNRGFARGFGRRRW